MKVLHIISGDLWAGAEVQAFTLLATLQKLPDIEVAAALMNEGELADRLRARNIPVTVLPENALSAFAIICGLCKLMREWQPDVIHTHRIKENILGSIANRLSANVPSVRTVHGATEHAARGFRQASKYILNFLNIWTGRHLQEKIIAVSHELAAKLTTDFPRRHIIVIENGVDIEAVRAQVHPVEFRANAPKSIHIGIVGRLVPVKRIDLFLEMAALLRDNNPKISWCFHIFGDGPLKAQLAKKAEQLRLNKTATFHGHCSHIISCINSLDALVMCSDHEGLPMTILEAMVLGIPIVAHAVGGLPSALSTYTQSVLITENVAIHYVQAVENIVKRPSSLAAAHIESHFSASENATKTINLYCSISGSTLS